MKMALVNRHWWYDQAQLGREEGGGLPHPFLKIEKKCPDFGQKVRIVSLLGLNLPFKM